MRADLRAALLLMTVLALSVGAGLGAQRTNIVDTANANPDFRTLATLIDAAGLADTLKSQGPYTVFAPTDTAFSAIPQSQRDELLKPENREKLQAILKYHVVSGTICKADLDRMTCPAKLCTLNGQHIILQHDAKGLLVNDARIVKTDVSATNGVIHVIDKVLMPPQQ